MVGTFTGASVVRTLVAVSTTSVEGKAAVLTRVGRSSRFRATEIPSPPPPCRAVGADRSVSNPSMSLRRSNRDKIDGDFVTKTPMLQRNFSKFPFDPISLLLCFSWVIYRKQNLNF